MIDPFLKDNRSCLCPKSVFAARKRSRRFLASFEDLSFKVLALPSPWAAWRGWAVAMDLPSPGTKGRGGKRPAVKRWVRPPRLVLHTSLLNDDLRLLRCRTLPCSSRSQD